MAVKVQILPLGVGDVPAELFEREPLLRQADGVAAGKE